MNKTKELLISAGTVLLLILGFYAALQGLINLGALVFICVAGRWDAAPQAVGALAVDVIFVAIGLKTWQRVERKPKSQNSEQ